MNKQHSHIIQIACKRFGQDNIIVLWKSSQLSSKYGIDLYYAIVHDGHIPGVDNCITSSFVASIEATSQTGKITEVYFGTPDYHMDIGDDDEILLCDTDDIAQYKTSPLSMGEHEERKGYRYINAQTTAYLASAGDAYDACFQKLQPILDDPSDSMNGTCRMLFYMREHLTPELVIDWFMHDTPLMRDLCNSTPFTHMIRIVSPEEYRKAERYVVDHPECFPPRPDYDMWITSILERGGAHINNFTKRFIPTSVL